MDKFVIKGPSVLKGKVLISGSKNAALPILASTLLFDKPVVNQNHPRVRDINTMINPLRSLGSKIEFFDNRKKNNKLELALKKNLKKRKLFQKKTKKKSK